MLIPQSMNTYSYFRASYEEDQLHKTLQTRRNPAIQSLHDSSMPARQLAQRSKADLTNNYGVTSMSDVKNTSETNPETEGLNVKLNTEAETNPTPAKGDGKRGGCGDGSKYCGSWQQGKRRWKIFAAAALIALFGFMLGKATSHHHNKWHQGAYQQQMYEGGASRLPMSMILDGIEATPAQRAKAVDLIR